MKLSSTGRSIALASVADVLLAACSSGSGPSASAAAPSAAAEVNQYFAPALKAATAAGI